MADETGISWCDSTFNAWIGCVEVGPGCDNCYARALSEKYGWAKWGAKEERHRTAPSSWKKPLSWQRNAAKFEAEHGRKRRVFVNSLSDVCDNQAPDAWRAELWDMVDACPDLNWIFVTKRISNALKMLPASWVSEDIRLPRPNAMLLATIVNQEEWERDLSKLLNLRTKMLVGISAEPLLGNLVLNAAGAFLDWIIVGGESRQNRTPGRFMPTFWAHDLQREAAAFGVPFHFKQMSNDAPIPQSLRVREWPRGW